MADALTEAARQAQHEMTVCNACRYCEAYCPVFQAMEERVTFSSGDLTYLANLCHNCGECLYACQYAPPHEFGINVPKTLSEIRVASYEEYCWPSSLSGAFKQSRVATVGAIVAAAIVGPLIAQKTSGPTAVAAVFYDVVPHDVMVALFAAVALLAIGAIIIARDRFLRDVVVMQAFRPADTAGLKARTTHVAQGFSPASSGVRGLRVALTLRHLHPGGVDCTSAEHARHPW